MVCRTYGPSQTSRSSRQWTRWETAEAPATVLRATCSPPEFCRSCQNFHLFASFLEVLEAFSLVTQSSRSVHSPWQSLCQGSETSSFHPGSWILWRILGGHGQGNCSWRSFWWWISSVLPWILPLFSEAVDVSKIQAVKILRKNLKWPLIMKQFSYQVYEYSRWFRNGSHFKMSNRNETHCTWNYETISLYETTWQDMTWHDVMSGLAPL